MPIFSEWKHSSFGLFFFFIYTTENIYLYFLFYLCQLSPVNVTHWNFNSHSKCTAKCTAILPRRQGKAEQIQCWGSKWLCYYSGWTFNSHVSKTAMKSTHRVNNRPGLLYWKKIYIFHIFPQFSNSTFTKIRVWILLLWLLSRSCRDQTSVNAENNFVSDREIKSLRPEDLHKLFHGSEHEKLRLAIMDLIGPKVSSHVNKRFDWWEIWTDVWRWRLIFVFWTQDDTCLKKLKDSVQPDSLRGRTVPAGGHSAAILTFCLLMKAQQCM